MARTATGLAWGRTRQGGVGAQAVSFTWGGVTSQWGRSASLAFGTQSCLRLLGEGLSWAEGVKLPLAQRSCRPLGLQCMPVPMELEDLQLSLQCHQDECQHLLEKLLELEQACGVLRAASTECLISALGVCTQQPPISSSLQAVALLGSG